MTLLLPVQTQLEDVFARFSSGPEEHRFAKTHVPLVKWFYAIYLFTTTRHGVPAKELERQLGVSYPTAFRMAHLIRNTEPPKADLPSKNADENRGIMTYATVASDFEHLDGAAMDIRLLVDHREGCRGIVLTWQ